MGKLTNLNPAAPIGDADLPALITRDSEYIAADKAHVDEANPHPAYPKSKVISFTTTSTSTQGFGIPHGLPFSKITGFTAVVETSPTGSLIQPNTGTNGGYAYTLSVDANNIYFTPGSSNAGLVSKIGRFLIFYVP